MRALVLIPALAAALPALAQDGRAWSLAVGDVEAHMGFGAPESDDRLLALYCTRKTGQIHVGFDVDRRLADRLNGQAWVDSSGRPAPWPVSVTLASATARTTVPGKADADEMNGGSSISVEVSDRAPVMAEFVKTGVLKLTALEQTVEAPPPPRGLAARLLRACKM